MSCAVSIAPALEPIMRPKPRKQRNEDHDNHKEADRDDPYNRLIT